MSAQRTLADRLNHLFEVVRPAGRSKPFSNPEVARAVSGRGDVQISPQYLWALRNGSRDNPTVKQLEALAAFFGVPPAYFLSDERAADIDEQLALLAAARDADVREILQRSSTLSGPDRLAVLRIVQRLSGDGDGHAEGSPS
ncbi:helix-turn-helix domain-containing protein [Symbioplanes lichenis]|uniref:helix-turn-helix domain-containing protein n=1 Tax=Symbioplanes lichenis TaxID=1629072 RepID=UPI00273A1342|nr:helix-turn-helix transcriptional regulator [Actinoplanes lichenis]